MLHSCESSVRPSQSAPRHHCEVGFLIHNQQSIMTSSTYQTIHQEWATVCTTVSLSRVSAGTVFAYEFHRHISSSILASPTDHTVRLEWGMGLCCIFGNPQMALHRLHQRELEQDCCMPSFTSWFLLHQSNQSADWMV